MSTEFNALYDLMHEKGLDMRTAAYVHALNRIGAAIQSQGTHRFFSNQSGT
jgi:glutamate dehydrogenase (NADP+)